ncbi:MAG: DUF1800 family protein [Bacteroidota bacterium]
MASLNPMSGVLGKRLAAHLLRRTTFGPSRADIDAFANKTVNQAINELLDPVGYAHPTEPRDPKSGQGTTWVYGQASTHHVTLRDYLAGWFFDEAFDNKLPHIAQRITFFLSTIFVSRIETARPENMYHQLRLLRHYSNGSIKAIARKICMDNAMIKFLDSQTSKAGSPNENFPRELLELFTIGKGPQIAPNNYTTYTEYDVQTAAKIFTGIKQENDWRNNGKRDPDTNIPRGRIQLNQHDTSTKVFSAAFGNRQITGGNNLNDIYREFDEFYDMVFNKIETAQNYVRKIYRFFVHSNITPEIEKDIIFPLATDLYNSNYNITVVMDRLLRSEHFYDADDAQSDDEIIGAFIKSPIELLLSSMKLFNLTPPLEARDAYEHYHRFWRQTVVKFYMPETDMGLLNPPSVAGYNAYHQAPAYSRAWVSPNTLPIRYKLADMLLENDKLLVRGDFYVELDVMDFVDNYISDPRDPLKLVQEIIDYAFPEAVPQARFDYFLNDLLLGNLSMINWGFEWDYYLNSGNDRNVRPQLEKLVRGVLQAPEFQLF